MSLNSEISIIHYSANSDTVGINYFIGLYGKLSNFYKLNIITNVGNIFSSNPNITVHNVEIEELNLLSFFKQSAKIFDRVDSSIALIPHDSLPVLFYTKKKVKFTSLFHQAHDLIGGLNINPFNLFGIKRFYFKQLTHHYLKKANFNIVVSPMLYDYLEKKLQIDKKRIELIPHGIDLVKYVITEYNTPEYLKKYKEYFKVVYTGWVNQMRGLNEIIDAHRIIQSKNLKIVFVVVGFEEKLLDEYNNRLKSLNLEENIILHGRVDSSEVPNIINEADVCLSLLNPLKKTYRLSPPQKIMEYFALGKPVIANKIETHDFLINDEYNGLIIELSGQSLADGILKLYSDDEFRMRLSKNALESSKQYDIDKQVKRIVEILDGL